MKKRGLKRVLKQKRYFHNEPMSRIKDWNKETNVSTWVSALKQCAKRRDLEEGKALHFHAVQAGCHTDKFIATALISMYTKCRSMRQARAVFDEMVQRDVVAWTCLILGYVENGESLIAMELFTRMNCEPDAFTFVAALKACANLASEKHSDRQFWLEKGVAIHRQMKAGADIFVANTLVDMYSKCGSMLHARAVFNEMVHRDVISWNNLLLGYVENGESLIALNLFTRMDCEPDCITFLAAIKACASLATQSQPCLEKGLAIHIQARKHGFERNIYVANTLIVMYRKCGSMVHARAVFDSMIYRDIVSWTNLIIGYVENGESFVAMELFRCMDCEPDSLTLVAALKASVSLVGEKLIDKQVCLRYGISIHEQARGMGLHTHILVANSLLDMYSKCGSMPDARAVFDNLLHRDAITWSSLILGYVDNEESLVAMELFTRMDCEPTPAILAAVLKACAVSSNEESERQFFLEKGRAIHAQAIRCGFDPDMFIGTALVDMYSKCGSTTHGQAFFDNMFQRSIVCWTTLLSGYAENGESLNAMELFMNMDCVPDSVAFVAALKACGNIGALAVGQRIHAQVCRLGLEHDQVLANCLVDFYRKSGSLTVAEQVFDTMHSRDVVSWTALVAGYSTLGKTSKVFNLVNIMQEAGLELDSITWVSILTACSHAGMVEEGMKYFTSMSRHGITPTVEHYACMVDMLCRANKLQEALALVKSMPYEATSVIWRTLLGSCRNSNNLEVGKVAFGALVSSNEENAPAYVLMGDLYTKFSEEVTEVLGKPDESLVKVEH